MTWRRCDRSRRRGDWETFAINSLFPFTQRVRPGEPTFKHTRARRRPDFDAVLRFARICRVERVMLPYLEAQV